MTDVLLVRGGFRDDSVLIRLHHTGSFSVRAVDGALCELRRAHFAASHGLAPACVVFHCEAASPRPLDVVSRLAAAYPGVAFVAILDCDDATDRERAVVVSELLEGGVAEVLSTEWDPVEICARVGRVVRVVRGGAPAAGTSGAAPSQSGRIGGPARPHITVDRVLVGQVSSVPLTPKEATLLAALLDSEAVVPRETLGGLLWTQGWSGTPKAIDMHVVSLRRKLQEVSEETWRIDTVRGVGFVLKRGGGVGGLDGTPPIRRLILAPGSGCGHEGAARGVA